jgi:O-antigen ligase
MLIAMMITAYYYCQNWTFANEIDEAHLGTSYYTVFILPTILFSPKKWVKYIAIAITGVVIISSFKRGGLIALVLGVIAYLFVKEVLFEHKVTKLILFVIIVITLFIVLIYIDNAMGNIISQRILNIQEDGGSGRDQVWATTWTMIRRSSPEHLIFGHGYNAVLNDSPLGLSAHNDFLEVLYNYGIVCFVPYIFLYLRLIQQIFAAIKLEDHRSFIMAFTCVVFILISMISHVIVYPWAALIALSWGFMSAPHSNNNIA